MMACEIPQYVVAFLEELPVFMGAGEHSDMQRALSPHTSFRDAYECTNGGREANGRVKKYVPV